MTNITFNKGLFPDFLKVSNIIFIHRKGNNNNYYKAISLSPNTIKLYEKSMHMQLINFLRKNKILFSYLT